MSHDGGWGVRAARPVRGSKGNDVNLGSTTRDVPGETAPHEQRSRQMRWSKRLRRSMQRLVHLLKLCTAVTGVAAVRSWSITSHNPGVQIWNAVAKRATRQPSITRA